VHLAARVHQQGEPHCLAGMDAQHPGAVDVRMIDGYGHTGRGRVDVQGAAAPAARQGVGSDDLVDHMEVGVVVVDEVAEQPVVGPGQLAQPHG
jgi:hypothetical protein